MAKRNNDLAFSPQEKLWRRLEKGDVHAGPPVTIKGNKLRLQVSVNREKYGQIGAVTQGKWNGVAETTAGSVAGIVAGTVHVACVDEPEATNDAHALIATYAAPGATVQAIDISEVRDKIAAAMTLPVPPTKP